MKKRLFWFFQGLLSLAYAQYPTLNWQYNTNAPAFGSAAAADMDGDGFYEIVFTTYTNDGRAHCLNAEDGSVSWIYDIAGCGDVAPVIYDVDNDDTLDVIVNGSCNPTIFCINGQTGQLKWSMPSGGGDSPPTIADIDHDSIPEILFCNFSLKINYIIILC
jgi:outer membrane protein assembly factor BamB